MKASQYSVKREEGSFLLLFGGFLIPVLGVLSLFLLQLLEIQTANAKAQQEIDRAAVAASKQLPYTKLAQQTAENILARSGILSNSQISITPSSVQILYTRNEPSFVARLLPSRAQASHRIAALSNTEVKARDIVIFVDASSYMAPEPGDSLEYSWNETSKEKRQSAESDESFETRTERSHWPAARFFKLHRGSFNLAGKSVPPRVVTQQCFNSAFSPLKESAIRLYDYYSAASNTAVSVLTGPGSLEQVTVLRNLIPSTVQDASPGEGRFDYYRDARNLSADLWCLQAAKTEPRSGHRGFWLPPRAASAETGLEAHYQDAPTATFFNSNLNFQLQRPSILSMRDIIWSLSARRRYTAAVPQAHVVDFHQVLEKSVYTLLAQVRGRQAVHSSKAAILLMGDIPWMQGQRLAVPQGNTAITGPRHQRHDTVAQTLRRTLRTLNRLVERKQERIQIFISFTKHLGNYPSDNYPFCVARSDDGRSSICEQFTYDTEALQDVLDSAGVASKNPRRLGLSVSLLRSPDTESMVKNIPAWVPLLTRPVIHRNSL